MTTLHPFTRACLAIAASLLAGTALAQSPSDMLDELRQLRAEMQQMRQELDALRQAAASRGAAGQGGGNLRLQHRPPRQPSLRRQKPQSHA